jgi:membrane-bound lytic murein transglycosylase D
MSAVDLYGLDARVDRWDSLAESLKDRRTEISRLRWLGALLVAPLFAVPVVWAEQDPVARATTLASITAARPTAVAPIPLEVNSRVERWINAFETSRSGEFERLMQQRGVFADMIRGKLRERGMPGGLLYIAMIESGLFPNAVSRVSAVGMWQFMSPTAMQYGLRVDSFVDERRDPLAATDAALDYLDWLHNRFGGSWYLAAAAFNAGPGRMERILNRHADGRFSDSEAYWEVLDYLPRETREYVPKMIALTMLANEADATGTHVSDVEPYTYDNVFVPGLTTLASIAETISVDEEALRALNPHLLRGVTPPNEIYGVRIPVGMGAMVVNGLSRRPMPMQAADDD